MPRFRTVAVAAIAVSALALAPSAAYAHDDGSASGTVGAVAEPRMAWGSYQGNLTDLVPDSDGVFDGASAAAFLFGVDGSTYVRLRIRGIDADDGNYGAHLHEGPCVPGDGAAAEPHYNISVKDALGKPSSISNATEVWLDFEVNSDGTARSAARVPFVPLGGDRAIVIHAEPTAPDTGTAGPRLACLPLHIQTLPSSE